MPPESETRKIISRAGYYRHWTASAPRRLDPKTVADSLALTSRIVDDVNRRIADGRRFLWGERLTLSDLSFATARAPLLLPPGYTAPIPEYDQMPFGPEAAH